MSMFSARCSTSSLTTSVAHTTQVSVPPRQPPAFGITHVLWTNSTWCTTAKHVASPMWIAYARCATVALPNSAQNITGQTAEASHGTSLSMPPHVRHKSRACPLLKSFWRIFPSDRMVIPAFISLLWVNWPAGSCTVHTAHRFLDMRSVLQAPGGDHLGMRGPDVPGSQRQRRGL
jgi:hypothetical protein